MHVLFGKIGDTTTSVRVFLKCYVVIPVPDTLCILSITL